jgi:hypothetical protein
MVQRILGFAFLLASLFMIWQGYENSRPSQETLEMSRTAVCELYGGCVKGVPNKTKTDIVRRQYEWLTPQGSYIATCQRAMIFSGPWSCETERGQLGFGGNY